MYPAISIIVPVYNAEKRISLCLDSILSQTFTDFEVILVNDGSTDSSGDVCEQYSKKDDRIKTYHKKNGGVASARQLGISLVTGEYTLHIDSDDWIKSDMLEGLYFYAKKNNADIVYFDYLIKDKQNKTRIVEQDFGESVDECVKSMLYHKMAGMLWSKMIKTALFSDNKIDFPEGLNMWEDFYFSLRCFLVSKKIAYLNKAYYCYVLNDGSMIDTITYEKANDKIEIAKKILSLLEPMPQFKDDLVLTKILAKVDFVGCREIYDPSQWKRNFPVANREILNMDFTFKLKIMALMANCGFSFMISPIKRMLFILKKMK